MRNKKRLLAITAGVALLAAGSTAGIAAAADNSEPTPKALDYVDGLDEVTDDWNDHAEELGGSLCDGCENSEGTDLVLMWQSVLAADGFLSADDIDGYFGADTEEATMEWQDDHSIMNTGEVDTDTWAAASENLEQPADDEAYYDGADDGSNVQFTRANDADGTYTLDYVTVGEDMYAAEGGDKIELFNQTIELTI